MAEGMSQLNVQAMVEDVLQQHGKRFYEEAALRRYEAARWLRKMVGVVLGKDLPAEPSEEDFRLGLRSGIILCSALNKIQPGSVPKKVEVASDGVVFPNGAPATPSQHSENVRNFLAAAEQMDIPTFDAFDLEKGGDTSRIVDCVLALKSFYEWKLGGGNGQWKLDGASESPMHRSSDLFLGFMARSPSAIDSWSNEDNFFSGVQQGFNDMGISPNLHKLICEMLADKNRDDIPVVVEHMLSKVMEEFERRLATQTGQIRVPLRDRDVLSLDYSGSGTPSGSRTPPASRTRIVTALETETTAASDDKVRTPLQDRDVSSFSFVVPKETEIQASSQPEKVSSPPKIELQEVRTPSREMNVSTTPKAPQPETNKANLMRPTDCSEKKAKDADSKAHLLKCKALVACQQRSIQELKKRFFSTREEMQMMQLKYQEQVEDLGKHMKFLANAAAGYQKVMDENRKLYNQIQDLKGNIRVYLRVRPFLPGQPNGSSAVDGLEERTITLLCPSKNGKSKKTSFTFNKVFGPSSSQEEVFVDTQPLIRSVLDGYNVCIFAYGQTGSGKTFTMTGPKELTKESLGVNYRALNDLFLISEDRKDTIAYEISVQMMEIYNEQVRDLLVTDGASKKLEIRNNTSNGINVPNANLVRVTSPSDVINLMNLGHKNRAVGSTNMNDRSSRSHSCLTVHVQAKDLTSGSTFHGCLHLVDLAGSERADKTDAVGDRLKEAQYINRSLSALGDVISSLAQKQAHVPYRNSKLTQLLQDSLGGQAKTLMFVHISPEPDALGETLSTLKFAERVSTIELGAAKTNKESGGGGGGGGDVKELREQIAALKAALARKEGDETGSLQHSIGSSPDTWAVRSYRSSSTASWNDIGQIEDASNSSRRHSLDSQDCPNSPSWPAMGTPDVNDSAIIDLDEQDISASDSSEVEHPQQRNLNRSISTQYAESKLRKPAPKMAAKSQERSPVPTKKAASNAASPASAKTSRQVTPVAAAKRKPVVKGK